MKMGATLRPPPIGQLGPAKPDPGIGAHRPSGTGPPGLGGAAIRPLLDRGHGSEARLGPQKAGRMFWTETCSVCVVAESAEPAAAGKERAGD